MSNFVLLSRYIDAHISNLLQNKLKTHEMNHVLVVKEIVNRLALELDIQIVAHHLCKM